MQICENIRIYLAVSLHLAAAFWLRAHPAGHQPVLLPLGSRFPSCIRCSCPNVSVNCHLNAPFLFFFSFHFLCVSAGSCGITTSTWPWPSSPRSPCSLRTSPATREPRSSTGEGRRFHTGCRTRLHAHSHSCKLGFAGLNLSSTSLFLCLQSWSFCQKLLFKRIDWFFFTSLPCSVCSKNACLV